MEKKKKRIQILRACGFRHVEMKGLYRVITKVKLCKWT